MPKWLLGMQYCNSIIEGVSSNQWLANTEVNVPTLTSLSEFELLKEDGICIIWKETGIICDCDENTSGESLSLKRNVGSIKSASVQVVLYLIVLYLKKC